MLVLDDAFWAQIDAQVLETGPEQNADVIADVVEIASFKASTVEEAAEPEETAVTDWAELLDTIVAAKGAAQERELQLREQGLAREALLQELQSVRQQALALEASVQRLQAEAEAQRKELLAQTEARVQAVQAEADVQVRRADERAHAAARRAAAAESWLKRIEIASRDLMPLASMAA